MSGTDRIAWGHTMVGAGLLLRRLSLPVAALLLAALVLAGAASGAAALETHWVLALPVLVLVVARVAALALGALGWVVFPPEHREVLSEVASRAEPAR